MKFKVKPALLKSYINQKELNILIANIYNSYLEEYRYDLNESLVKKNSKKENPIYSSFLEALEIDEDDYEFIHLASSYELASLKELDENSYLNNPYYKNIKIKPTNFKNWRLDYSSYKSFELFQYQDIDVKENNYFKEISHFGYFRKPFNFIEVKEKDITWMSITPHEINTMKNDLLVVEGRILVLGLGLGYFPYMASLSDKVTSITIIERDINVIELFKKEIEPQFDSHKISIIKDDAIHFLEVNKYNFDFVYCDLYHNALDALPLYLKINKFEDKFKSTTFLYWIEESLLAYLRRFVISLFEEYLEGYNEKDYLSNKTFEDKLMNALFRELKNVSLSSKEDIDTLLSSKNLKKLAKTIKI